MAVWRRKQAEGIGRRHPLRSGVPRPAYGTNVSWSRPVAPAAAATVGGPGASGLAYNLINSVQPVRSDGFFMSQESASLVNETEFFNGTQGYRARKEAW